MLLLVFAAQGIVVEAVVAVVGGGIANARRRVREYTTPFKISSHSFFDQVILVQVVYRNVAHQCFWPSVSFSRE